MFQMSFLCKCFASESPEEKARRERSQLIEALRAPLVARELPKYSKLVKKAFDAKRLDVNDQTPIMETGRQRCTGPA